jgi:hypothetical protein
MVTIQSKAAYCGEVLQDLDRDRIVEKTASQTKSPNVGDVDTEKFQANPRRIL